MTVWFSRCVLGVTLAAATPALAAEQAPQPLSPYGAWTVEAPLTTFGPALPVFTTDAAVVGARSQQIVANVLGWSALGLEVFGLIFHGVAALQPDEEMVTAKWSTWTLTAGTAATSTLLFATTRATANRHASPDRRQRAGAVVATSLMGAGILGVVGSMAMLDASGDSVELGVAGFGVLAAANAVWVTGLILNSRNTGRRIRDAKSSKDEWGSEEMGLMLAPLALPQGGGASLVAVF